MFLSSCIRFLLFGLTLLQASVAGAEVLSDKFISSQIAENARPVDSLEVLPQPVQYFLLRRFVKGIAPMGGNYLATDVISDQSIPTRRLVAAGEVWDLVYILYEHGGRGHHQHFVVFRMVVNDAEPVLIIRNSEDDSLEDFLNTLIEGKYKNELSTVDKYGYW